MALKHLITQGFVFCDGEIGWLITDGFGTLAADEGLLAVGPSAATGITTPTDIT